VISLAEQFGNRAAQREFGIVESKVSNWRKQKELLKNAESGNMVFCGPKAGKSTYFTHPDFSLAKLEKSAQITRINTGISAALHYCRLTFSSSRCIARM
jgi:hypothetical protein